MNEAEIAGKEPLSVEVEAGKEYWWCSCGKSANQPFCDGSHAGSGFEPLSYKAKENTTVWFCCCKRTANAPLCDGSHQKL